MKSKEPGVRMMVAVEASPSQPRLRWEQPIGTMPTTSVRESRSSLLSPGALLHEVSGCQPQRRVQGWVPECAGSQQRPTGTTGRTLELAGFTFLQDAPSPEGETMTCISQAGLSQET